MNATTLNSLTDAELIRHAMNKGDALSQLLAERLEAVLPSAIVADILGGYVDFNLARPDAEKLRTDLDALVCRADEAEAERDEAKDYLKQAEREIEELRAELRELERQGA